ncbi:MULTISPECIES: DsbE family thiol:disulfide interchange protein [unclassified Bartonella]|uniref:DsbE family thiol:disulfide interchange protein n=1 Tax=unclassified Bartonella TaxID=2645622 RepID=UPI000999279B|nr:MULTISPECIES: DsbE family thiol:disulfide interchange protein [unclassified Bartonella]AQX28698.1 cytochrome c biogenesis protein CcmG, thiol:disulfide interchange protein DsbE [Bartonella sp. JB15]AQX29952.1 cytochrome c biogenesis protein CcmG, thiol:disulfide interchange protein DsbE [Bartonella sp. JB63]
MKVTPLKPKQSVSFPVLLSFLCPFFLFLLLVIFFFNSIKSKHSRDTSFISNALVGKLAPQTRLPLLNSKDYFNLEQLKGRVTLINFWSSWCLPCRAEHPILTEIARDKRFDLIGINYKDNQDNAQRFLNNFGNPFKLIGFDASGLTAINWGIYGLPEIFILNKESIIIGKHTGPLTWQIYQKEILPKIEKAITTN